MLLKPGQLRPFLISSLAANGWPGGLYQGVNPIHALATALDQVFVATINTAISSALWVPSAPGLGPPMLNIGGVLTTAPLSAALPPLVLMAALAAPTGASAAASAGWAGPYGSGLGRGLVLGMLAGLGSTAKVFTTDEASLLLIAAGPPGLYWKLTAVWPTAGQLFPLVSAAWVAQPGMEGAEVSALSRTAKAATEACAIAFEYLGFVTGPVAGTVPPGPALPSAPVLLSPPS